MLSFISFTANTDYIPSIGQLTFQSDHLEQCANIAVLEDTVLEDTEEFSVQLNTTDQAVDFTIETATVTLLNDDSELSYVIANVLKGSNKLLIFSRSECDVTTADVYCQGRKWPTKCLH